MPLHALVHVPTTRLSPFFPIPVPAGTAHSVEQDQIEWINIHDYLRRGSDSVAYIRVAGDSMVGDKIHDGDILVVRRSAAARAGQVVIAEVNGEFTVKRLQSHSHGLFLVPANDNYPVRRVHPSDTFTVWAIVMHVIHSFDN